MSKFLSSNILINLFANYWLFILSSHIGPSFIKEIITEVVRLMTYSAGTLSKKLPSWYKLSLFFLCKIRTELIISTWIAVVHITNFGSTLCAFFFSSINSYKDSQIKICLETYHGYNVFTMTTCGWAYRW